MQEMGRVISNLWSSSFLNHTPLIHTNQVNQSLLDYKNQIVANDFSDHVTHGVWHIQWFYIVFNGRLSDLLSLSAIKPYIMIME